MEIVVFLLMGCTLLCLLSDWTKKIKAYFSPTKHPEPEKRSFPAEFDFTAVQEKLVQIQKISAQIQSIENLVTDMELTSPEYHELPLEMKWADTATGQQHTFQFWVDGRVSTQLLLETAYQERQQLRTSLSEQISDLYHTAVEQTWNERCNFQQGRESNGQ